MAGHQLHQIAWRTREIVFSRPRAFTVSRHGPRKGGGQWIKSRRGTAAPFDALTVPAKGISGRGGFLSGTTALPFLSLTQSILQRLTIGFGSFGGFGLGGGTTFFGFTFGGPAFFRSAFSGLGSATFFGGPFRSLGGLTFLGGTLCSFRSAALLGLLLGGFGGTTFFRFAFGCFCCLTFLRRTFRSLRRAAFLGRAIGGFGRALFFCGPFGGFGRAPILGLLFGSLCCAKFLGGAFRSLGSLAFLYRTVSRLGGTTLFGGLCLGAGSCFCSIGSCLFTGRIAGGFFSRRSICGTGGCGTFFSCAVFSGLCGGSAGRLCGSSLTAVVILFQACGTILRTG